MNSAGSSQETQREFVELFESAVIEESISESIQRYQLAVSKAKVKLDYAISPGCWLLPSKLVINQTRVSGYNNSLIKATSAMKFGINAINTEIVPQTPPHFVAPSKKHLAETQAIPTETHVLPPDDHHLLKAGLTVASIGLGYYFMNI